MSNKLVASAYFLPRGMVQQRSLRDPLRDAAAALRCVDLASVPTDCGACATGLAFVSGACERPDHGRDDLRGHRDDVQRSALRDFGSTAGTVRGAAHRQPRGRSRRSLRRRPLGVVATVVGAIVVDDAARPRYRSADGTIERRAVPTGSGDHDDRVTRGPGLVLAFSAGDVDGGGFSDLIVTPRHNVPAYSRAAFTVTGSAPTLRRT
jgi:hypothetical protein